MVTNWFNLPRQLLTLKLLISCEFYVMTKDQKKKANEFVVSTRELIQTVEKIFYYSGLWPKDDSSIYYKIYGIFIFTVFYIAYAIATVLGMLLSSDFVEKIHLTLVCFAWCAVMFRIVIFYQRRDQIQCLLADIHDYALEDRKQYMIIEGKIRSFVKFAYFLSYVISASIFVFMCLPFLSSEKVLIIRIWVPLNWERDTIAFWITYLYSLICIAFSVASLVLAVLIWYIMLNISIKYEMLGYELLELGKGTDSGKFNTNLVLSIEHHLEINCQIARLKDVFNSLFTFQVTTSVVSLCAGVFVLAFIKPNTPIDYLFYLITLIYLVMEIFLIMYYGNEITFYCNNLSTHLFQSDWTEQTVKYRKYVIILMQFLKNPQRIIVGFMVVIPLNLQAFTKILNASYSLFNLLRTF